MRNLGLIGGLAPGATIHYYRQLAKAQAGELLIVHADLDAFLGMLSVTIVPGWRRISLG